MEHWIFFRTMYKNDGSSYDIYKQKDSSGHTTDYVYKYSSGVIERWHVNPIDGSFVNHERFNNIDEYSNKYSTNTSSTVNQPNYNTISFADTLGFNASEKEKRIRGNNAIVDGGAGMMILAIASTSATGARIGALLGSILGAPTGIGEVVIVPVGIVIGGVVGGVIGWLSPPAKSSELEKVLLPNPDGGPPLEYMLPKPPIPNGDGASNNPAFLGPFPTTGGTTPVYKVDPLIIDLDGNGFNLNNQATGAYFDLDKNGFAESTGWVSGNDIVLAMDRNNNGLIDDGGELFGDQTILKNGQKATSGVQALAELDTNADGKIDINDTNFGKLYGIKADGSIISLSDAGVKSISLTSTSTNEVINSNTLARTVNVTKTDGTIVKAGDFLLDRNVTDSIATDWVEISDDVAALPEVSSYGNVRWLSQAMQLDTTGTLKALVKQFTQSTDMKQRLILLDNILEKWTGSDSIDPASRGGYNAKKLAVVESFAGKYFMDDSHSIVQVGSTAAVAFDQSYTLLKNEVYAQLMSQSILKDLYSSIFTYNATDNTILFSLDAAKTKILADIAQTPEVGKQELFEFARSLKELKLADNDEYKSFYNSLATAPLYKSLIDASSSNNIIFSKDNETQTEGTGISDVVFGTATNNTIYSRQGNDVIFAGAGNDYLDSCQGDDVVYGEAGDDTILGGDGNDIISGGAGNDIINGGNGNDTYLFGTGDGNDIITDNFAYSTDAGIDTLKFTGTLKQTDIAVRGENSDLVITIKATGETIRLTDQFTPNFRIENFVFSDGTTLSYDNFIKLLQTQGTAGNDTITGSAFNEVIYGNAGNDTIDSPFSNDTIYGGDGNDIITSSYFYNDYFKVIYGEAGNDTIISSGGNDTISGGAGNDVINGGNGNDIYLFGNGDGNDIITDNISWATDAGNDTLKFIGTLKQTDIAVRGENSDLVITIKATGETIRLTDQFTPNFRIENFSFSDGTIVSFDNLLKSLQTQGTAGNDTITGSAFNEVIYGNAGNDTIDSPFSNDTIYGGDGNDIITSSYFYNDYFKVIYGESGNDTIASGGGNDTISGGAGNDVINGGNGNDTYLFGTGDGNDIIKDDNANSTDSGNDILKFTGTLKQTDIAVRGENSDLVITIKATGETIRLTDQFTPNYRIENFSFSDGTIVSFDNFLKSLQTQGTASNDTITGSYFDEVIYGNAGNDTIDSPFSNDTIYGGDGNDIITSSYFYNDYFKVIYGESGNDTIASGGGNDTISGGAGNDVINGGNGNDTYLFGTGDGNDIIKDDNAYSTDSGNDTLKFTGTIKQTDIAVRGENCDLVITIKATGETVRLVNQLTPNYRIENFVFSDGTSLTYDNLLKLIQIQGTAGNDIITGSYFSESIYGNAGNDIINSSDGDDFIDGGIGADTMIGGSGCDTYIVDNIGDVVTENLYEGTDSVYSSINYSLVTNVENLTLTGTTAVNGMGNTLNNSITGNAADNSLDGGVGSDTMIGGLGNDIYIVDNIGDIVTENLNEGTDLVKSSVNYSLGANIENLTLTSTTAINGIGNDLNNSITGYTGNNYIDGGAGDDYIDGGIGADTMIGGLGNDTYIVDNIGDIVTETSTLAIEIDSVNSIINYTLGANIENLTLSGTTAINGTGNELDNSIAGNSAANILTGGAGNDTINGGAGNDTMIGGIGNDTYYVDVATDVIIENLNEGTDTVNSSINYSLTTNIENLTLTGSTAINATGNTLNNYIVGNTLNNIIDGGLGIDTMVGGTGDDTYTVDVSTDVIVENTNEGTDSINSSTSYTLGANIENLTLSGTTAINGTGNELDNSIAGNSAANILTGGAGNDTINGGAGNDTMIGGIGNDTYYVDVTTDTIIENTNEGIDTINSTTSYTLGANLENLTLTGTTVINGTGNELDNSIAGNSAANILTGGAGNDTINGGAGNDTMIGGIGNDTYYVDVATDVIIENLNEGIDTVNSIASYTLAANIENLTLTGNTAINATGNTLNNNIVGNGYSNIIDAGAGNDTIDGGLGIDTMIGGLGNDTYIVDNIGDIVTETSTLATEIDSVYSSVNYSLVTNVENLTLTGTTAVNGMGNTLNNSITGNAADNSLDGGVGSDTMIGGLGNDIYIVDNIGDIVTENLNEGTDLVKSSVNYSLGANIENLTLTSTTAINGIGNDLNNSITGYTGNNYIDGGAGDDYIDGGIGADTMIGGLGNDTYIVDNIGDIITETSTLATEIDTVNSSITYSLATNVENLTLTGSTAINGTGNALNNIITGNTGNNTLDGGIGIDTMIGGLGNDTYYVDNSGDVISENLNEGIDAVSSTASYSLSTNIENLTLTGTAAINGIGNVLNNSISGNAANNTLDGGLGADAMSGGLGNDTYIVDNIGDIVTETSTLATEIDSVYSSVNYSLVTNVENLTLTGTTAVNGMGNTLNNSITGNAADNSLDGGVGSDTMIGGLGNDIYIVDNIGDIVTENLNEGTDLVKSSVNYSLGANIENLTLTSTTAINGIGNDLNNSITGYTGNNYIDGGAGDDYIDGGIGADTMIGGLGNDTYIVDNIGDIITETSTLATEIDTVNSSITYSLATNVENLTLTGSTAINGTGNALNNIITGNTGNNTLDGGIGIDTMIGGLGNDTYYVDNSGDVISENLNEGIDAVSSTASYSLSTNIENLTLTGTAAINGIGNVLNNSISGNAANNTLDGGLGADAMSGGLGNDTYIVDNIGDIVTETSTLATEIDSVYSSVNYSLVTNVENLTLTGTTAVNGMGNTLNNSITGNAADNSLDGGVGSDTMIGGLGNDIYIVDNIGDIVTENLNEGTDLVKSSVNYSLGANIENLTLTSTTAINGTGNDLNNIITGNAGNNTLDGGIGIDTMIGGLGNDTYIVDNIGDIVTESLNEGTDLVYSSVNYSLSANLENLTLTGTTAINGTGNVLNNSISGNAGNNTLDGGLGADTMTGGLGNDTYIVDNIGDIVTESLNEGTDLVYSSVNYSLVTNVENLTLTGTTAVNGMGNTLNNSITGNAADNSLDGGVGSDTMIGGLGNDIYIVDNIGDIVTENLNEGTDLVKSSVNYSLGANIENLTLTSTTAINGIGNDLSNSLTGNAGNNYIDGGAGDDYIDGGIGADTMIGGLGNDTYIVENSNDICIENSEEGIDTVNSSTTYTLSNNVENLTLTGSTAINGTGNELDNTIIGNSVANKLMGGNGNDVLNGGASADTMIGGTGDDTYFVDNIGDVIIESEDEGDDTINSYVTYTLSSNVENLTLAGSSALNGKGNDLDNVIIGNSNANTLNGGLGQDLIAGGLGNDIYIVDNIGDVVIENVNEGTDTINTSVSYTLSANVENLTLIETDNIDAIGNELNNILIGNASNNIIDGCFGADVMSGGAGNDTYIIDNTGDIVTESTNSGVDTALSTINYILANNIENLILAGSDDINGTGNTLNNIITGNDGNNILNGGAGIDTLVGGFGNDTYIVDTITDIIIECEDYAGIDIVQSSVSYTLGEFVENLTLTGTLGLNGTGNSLDNSIIGNSGNNTLDGAAGNNTLIGGLGNDTYIIDDSPSANTIVEKINEGIDTVISNYYLGYILGSNIENLTLIADSDYSEGKGNELNNMIIGSNSSNIIDGGLGTDTMIGGKGNDTYFIDNIGDLIIESANEGIDTVNSSISYSLLTTIENLQLIGTANINGTGNTLNNIITGNDGNNTLNGGAGIDTLVGGFGDDTYVVDTITDIIIECDPQYEGYAGVDTVQSSVSYTLGEFVENLTLTGTLGLNGTGNSLDNSITGNSGNNTLDGGSGNNTLIGGAGNDTYIDTYIDDAPSTNTIVEKLNEGIDTVISNYYFGYTLGSNIENLTLITNSDDAVGVGNELNNIIIGSNSSNIIDGGLGSDTMIGGKSNDTYFIDNIGDLIIESANEGIDTVNSSISYSLLTTIENLQLIGTANINGTGNTLNNIITGNDGNNTLNGGAGIDTLVGGFGDDTYVVDTITDIIIECDPQYEGYAGVDTVQSSVSYTLGEFVENLTLTGTLGLNGTGNSLDNSITGNSGNNTLDGGSGNNTLIGGAGNDTYIDTYIDDAPSTNTIVEKLNEGIDTVISNYYFGYTLGSNIENLTLITNSYDAVGVGNELNNIITGTGSSNIIDGKAGADTM
ncbi:MAG: calcium-binding protein [bacterium]